MHIMAGVIKRLFRPQKEMVLDRRIMELQTAKEIPAEVFGIRLQDMDEMIQNRFGFSLFQVANLKLSRNEI
jgi:hypothetical protein